MGPRQKSTPDSVRVVNEKERERRAPKAPTGVRSEEGVSPSPVGEGSGEGLCPVPRNFFDFFLSGNVAFWCILGACFNVTKACKIESKSSFVCQLPIGQLSHMADVSSMISYT